MKRYNELTQQEYLYGSTVELPKINQEAIDARLVALKAHLQILLDENYLIRDGVRCNSVMKAIKFWENIQ